MAAPRNTRPRGDGRSSRKRRASDAELRHGPKAPSIAHPMFGEIPLVPVQWIDAGGEPRSGYAYDAEYSPPLPKGAVRGEISRQPLTSGFDVPRYFYVDVHKTCVQCGEPFVFGAAEQKYWYETLKFNFASVATRCTACRKKRRSAEALRRELAAAKAAARASPDDPAVLFGLSEALARYNREFGEGSLPEALAAARKAGRILRGRRRETAAREALFWEAACHALGGRRAKAKALFEEFLSGPRGGKRLGALAREAKAWLRV